jgi:hypothetical protein
VTIKQAFDLKQVSRTQLCAVSNTTIVIFRRDQDECSDMRHYF